MVVVVVTSLSIDVELSQVTSLIASLDVLEDKSVSSAGSDKGLNAETYPPGLRTNTDFGNRAACGTELRGIADDSGVGSWEGVELVDGDIALHEKCGSLSAGISTEVSEQFERPSSAVDEPLGR